MRAIAHDGNGPPVTRVFFVRFVIFVVSITDLGVPFFDHLHCT
jgi:hypothetical protein